MKTPSFKPYRQGASKTDLQSSGSKQGYCGDFPGGPVIKNPPYNAGDAALIPGQGTKIPRATEKLSPPATTTELARLN